MATQDKVMTIKGSDAAVTSVTLQPQDDGSILLLVYGTSREEKGEPVALNEVRVRLSDSKSIQAFVDLALLELRKANGLDG